MADGLSARASTPTSLRSAVASISAARGQARQFWRVFDNSRIPMVVVDSDRRYLAANVAARLVFRRTLGDFRSRRIGERTPPHMRRPLHEMWERLIRAGAAFGRFDVGFSDGSELPLVYCALANVLPARHLIVFVPANWPGDELSVVEEPAPQPGHGPLSRREREVLTLIAAGAGVEQIAAELMISAATVRTHTRNALRKLRAHTRAHAIALAIRQGMIDPPGPGLERVASSG